LYYFDSPNKAIYNIPGATATKVMNYLPTPPISLMEFDAMTDDSKLAALTINDTNDSFSNRYIAGIILFQLSDGRKGAIKTQALNSTRLVVNIKIQKY
jgi:hypothetical protein